MSNTPRTDELTLSLIEVIEDSPNGFIGLSNCVKALNGFASSLEEELSEMKRQNTELQKQINTLKEQVPMEDIPNYITLHFKGDPNRPCDIDQGKFTKLKESGMMWEVFPDAPNDFPEELTKEIR